MISSNGQLSQGGSISNTVLTSNLSVDTGSILTLSVRGSSVLTPFTVSYPIWINNNIVTLSIPQMSFTTSVNAQILYLFNASLPVAYRPPYPSHTPFYLQFQEVITLVRFMLILVVPFKCRHGMSPLGLVQELYQVMF